MSSSKNVATTAYNVIGKVTKEAVVKTSGKKWGTALDAGTQVAQASFPRIDTVKIHGAKAHQSHKVPSHSAVLSVAFYDGKKRVVSGHIHQDGSVDFSQAGGSSSGSGSAMPQVATGLTWQMDPHNPHQALWWNGSTWEKGQWSDENQLWFAYYNDECYAWM